jgi:ankyrin repeat protein
MARFYCLFLLQLGKTALMFASEQGHTATVQALLEAGANPSVCVKVFNTRSVSLSITVRKCAPVI